MDSIKISDGTKAIIIIVAAFLLFMMLESCAKEPCAKVEITRQSQTSLLAGTYLDTATNTVHNELDFGPLQLQFKVINKSYYEIKEYHVYFTILLADGTYQDAEFWGTGLSDIGHGQMDIETNGKQFAEVQVEDLILY